MEFLGQRADDSAAGSPALRPAVVAEAAAESEKLDFSEALDGGPAIRAVLLAAGAGLVAAILGALDPRACQTAAARLANPLGGVSWPQTTHLALRSARRSRGEGADVRGRGNRRPRRAAARRSSHPLSVSRPGACGVEECGRMQWSAGPWLPGAKTSLRPFAYWIEGGDDHSMRPIQVEVVEPPRVESLAVRLFPPSYTGWPEEDSERNIRAWWERACGSWPGEQAAPLGRRLLRGRPPTPTRVSEDGMSFIAGGDGDSPLRIEKSGAYWFKLVRSARAVTAAATTAGKSAPCPRRHPRSPSSGRRQTCRCRPGPCRRCESRPRTIPALGGSPWCSPVRIGRISRRSKCRCTRAPCASRGNPSAGCRRMPGRRRRGQSTIAGTFLRWNCRREPCRFLRRRQRLLGPNRQERAAAVAHPHAGRASAARRGPRGTDSRRVDPAAGLERDAPDARRGGRDACLNRLGRLEQIDLDRHSRLFFRLRSFRKTSCSAIRFMRTT